MKFWKNFKIFSVFQKTRVKYLKSRTLIFQFWRKTLRQNFNSDITICTLVQILQYVHSCNHHKIFTPAHIRRNFTPANITRNSLLQILWEISLLQLSWEIPLLQISWEISPANSRWSILLAHPFNSCKEILQYKFFDSKGVILRVIIGDWWWLVIMTNNLLDEYDTQLVPVCDDTQNLNETESNIFLYRVFKPSS